MTTIAMCKAIKATCTSCPVFGSRVYNYKNVPDSPAITLKLSQLHMVTGELCRENTLLLSLRQQYAIFMWKINL